MGAEVPLLYLNVIKKPAIPDGVCIAAIVLTVSIASSRRSLKILTVVNGEDKNIWSNFSSFPLTRPDVPR